MNKRKQETKLVLRLYITAGADSSRRAMANLQVMCKEYFQDNVKVEIVDTLQEPLRAMQDGIVVTPTLVKLAPEPTWTIVGDLSEDARILASMHAVSPPSISNAKNGTTQTRGGKDASFERRVRTAS